uniref:FZ domain-containing protein n=1 Tax=Knipowitschia caucasica TaxID=637954 RepID=A0AAV2LD66_KNICA
MTHSNKRPKQWGGAKGQQREGPSAPVPIGRPNSQCWSVHLERSRCGTTVTQDEQETITETPGTTTETPEDISRVGEAILNVASGISKSVEEWGQNASLTPAPSPGATNGIPTEDAALANTTGNTAEGDDGRGVIGQGAGRCLPVPPDWPICASERPAFFSLPNFLNHTSAEQVGAELRRWAWLVQAGCHSGAEVFLCRLLVPACSQHAGLVRWPCPEFCYGLQDRCWQVLEDGDLPLGCDLLPRSDHCVWVRSYKGDKGLSFLQLLGQGPGDSTSRGTGPQGESSYIFSRGSVSGQPAVALLPNPFYRYFSLLFHIKPTSDTASVLLAVTDGPQNIMYVGVKLSAVVDGKQKVQFFYTEPDSDRSYEAASFSVPSMVGRWSRFALSVSQEEQVSFYHGCDSAPQVLRFERSPDPMDLDKASGVFVGQAGRADPDKFQGEVLEMRLVGDPQEAEHLCDGDDDTDAASGDFGSGAGDRSQTGNRVQYPRSIKDPAVLATYTS